MYLCIRTIDYLRALDFSNLILENTSKNIIQQILYVFIRWVVSFVSFLFLGLLNLTCVIFCANRNQENPSSQK